jgi:hypothetical protein
MNTSKTTIIPTTKAILIKTPTYLQQSYIDEKSLALPRHALNFQTPKIAFNPLAIRKIDKIKPVDNKPRLLL